MLAKKYQTVRFILLFIVGLLIFRPLTTAQIKDGSLSVRQKVSRDAKSLSIGSGYLRNLKWDLPLAFKGGNGSKIDWKSLNHEYLSDEGKLIKRSSRDGKKINIKIVATISMGSSRVKKAFDITIAYEEQEYHGYLFTYFEGSGPRSMDEQIRFAASADAVNWFALNKNRPILSSQEISGTGGIRDPHILRSEDDKHFLMVATDMNTAKNGWAHNPGIVMLRSEDLTNWEHGYINLEEKYPAKFKNIQWVWAPQTIYDPQVDRYMVYFTVKYKDDPKLDFYGAYATDDFKGFENEPSLLFRPKYGGIDGDIIYKNGEYHFFYKGNTKDETGKEIKNGIQQATGKTLQGPWSEDFRYLDAYSPKKIVVEGSSIFKLNNSDTYILMYDLYTNHRYEFQRSKDLYSFSPEPESFKKDFYPRHGSVMGITYEEAKRLNDKWGGAPESLLRNRKN